MNINAEILTRRDSRPDRHRPNQHKIAERQGWPGLVLRLEHVLIDHAVARDGVGRFLAEYPGRYAIISNNSRDTAASLVVKLKRVGLDVPPSSLILAGEETLRIMAQRQPQTRVLFAGSRVIFYAGRRLGLLPVQSEADVVLVGRDACWDHGLLTAIINEMAGGARLIGCNRDAAAIGRSGRIVPDTGALIAAIEAATGARATYPADEDGGLVAIALDRMDCTPRDAILFSGTPADHAEPPALTGLRRIDARKCGFDPEDFARSLVRDTI